MTYYVVGKLFNLSENTNTDIYYYNSLLPLVNLPAGSTEFLNPLESEGNIRTQFKNKRGVYLWTNKINNNQYIGSAMNLSSRLSDYFQNSYLNYQASRGSAISAAILKHGLSQFTLQLIELGSSPSRDSISVNSDLILLEQYYLDSYKLIYNIRRLALGPAPVLCPDYKNLPIGDKNLQYGKEGVKSAAWDHKHSEDQKRLWSFTRSTPIFIYNLNSLTFNSIVYGYERLADFLGVHTNTARRAVKSNIYSKQYILSLSELNNETLLTIKESIKPKSIAIKKIFIYNKDKSILLKTYQSVNAFMKIYKVNGSDVKILCTTDKLWLDEYYLSYELIDDADNTLTTIDEFNPNLKSNRARKPIYAYSSDGKLLIKRYSSLRECVKDLEGNRNANTKSLELRIKHKELYHGLRVSYSPLFDHEE